MTKPSVAYLGSRSSYSHQAALRYFDPKEYHFEGQTTIRDVFEAVQSSAVTRGVVPFENSTNGSVVYTLDLFCDRQGAYPDINVCGEVYVDVHHNLLSRSDSHSSVLHEPKVATNLTPSLECRSRFPDIRHIYSHPQAFGQCEVFLNLYLTHAERHDVSSTSKAAEVVSLDETRTSAAISSEVAAEEYGLNILAHEIEDRTDNTTRFLIIRKGNDRPEPTTRKVAIESPCEGNEAVWRYKSLLSFTIDHRSAGALADTLMVFKTYRLNLTSINSRPTQVLPWHYTFFVEFEGSEWDDPDGAVKGALKDLKQTAKDWRWFGSWRNQLNL